MPTPRKATHNPPWHYKHGRFDPSESKPFDAYRISVTEGNAEIMLAIVPESEANAAFIIHRVNMFDQLMAFVQGIHAELAKEHESRRNEAFVKGQIAFPNPWLTTAANLLARASSGRSK